MRSIHWIVLKEKESWWIISGEIFSNNHGQSTASPGESRPAFEDMRRWTLKRWRKNADFLKDPSYAFFSVEIKRREKITKQDVPESRPNKCTLEIQQSLERYSSETAIQYSRVWKYLSHGVVFFFHILYTQWVPGICIWNGRIGTRMVRRMWD